MVVMEATLKCFRTIEEVALKIETNLKHQIFYKIEITVSNAR